MSEKLADVKTNDDAKALAEELKNYRDVTYNPEIKKIAKKYHYNYLDVNLLIRKRKLYEGYDKKLNPNTNVCYIYTPNSAKFYKDLSDTFKHLPNQEGYKQLMDEICIPFNMIEMESKFQFNYLFNHSIVEMNYKKKGIKLTEEQIQEKMRSAEKNIMDFAKTKIRVDFPLKHLRKNVDGKDYLKIGNNMVEYGKLGNFINIMRDNMNPLMIWIAHKMKSNEERITIPMMDKMVELFIKIEEDPQIKV